MSDLRAVVMLGDLDRKLTSQGIHLFLTRRLVLPLMLVALVGMVLALILGFGAPTEVVGGIMAVAGAAAGFASWAHWQEDDLGDLEQERGRLLHDHPSLELQEGEATHEHELSPPSDTAG